ncbi:uncharacterized protein [Miscanthus floridulus]|uniref:uncharacterized protein n=1 Tax=Miscanthus floridulus TaxID=154761 RepID=UPI003458215A
MPPSIVQNASTVTAGQEQAWRHDNVADSGIMDYLGTAREAGRRSLRRRRAGVGAGCGTPGASRGSLRRWSRPPGAHRAGADGSGRGVGLPGRGRRRASAAARKASRIAGTARGRPTWTREAGEGTGRRPTGVPAAGRAQERLGRVWAGGAGAAVGGRENSDVGWCGRAAGPADGVVCARPAVWCA